MDVNKKLTSEQFSEIARMLPEIRIYKHELAELAKNKPDRIKAVFGECSSWSGIYERSFIEQLAYLFILLGLHEQIIKIKQSSSQHQAIINMTKEGAELDQWYESNKAIINKTHLLWLAIVLQRNVLSIMLFHQSLGALVDQVRQGNDDALFKAVSVDRSIVSCPTFADRLSRAELENDKQFFMHLRKSLKGPSLKNMAAIGDLRYAIVLLREAGFDKYTDDQLISLFVNAGLYPKHPSAAKNLRKHIYAARKFATT